jgi:hypothetical protein
MFSLFNAEIRKASIAAALEENAKKKKKKKEKKRKKIRPNRDSNPGPSD